VKKLSLAFVFLSLAACNDGLVDVNLERMIHQRKYRAFQACEFFADGRVMRTPPRDTVPRSRITGDPAFADGVEDGTYVDRIPLEVTRDVLERGRDRFETFCAACHGVAGDGDSIVAANMQERRPPSLVDSEVRAYPVGRIFAVVTKGYGLMRSYEEDLSIDERWATISYLRALQIRSGVPLASLPLDLRTRAESQLR
jgi:mono/diheme cytochrome c family protein